MTPGKRMASDLARGNAGLAQTSRPQSDGAIAVVLKSLDSSVGEGWTDLRILRTKPREDIGGAGSLRFV